MHGVQGLGKKFRPLQCRLQVVGAATDSSSGTVGTHEALALFNIRSGTRVISRWQRQYHAQSLVSLQRKLRGKVTSSGAPSYRPALPRQMGEQVNHKTVQRLMQSLELKSLVSPKQYGAWRSQQVGVPNVLNRQHQATRPNQE